MLSNYMKAGLLVMLVVIGWLARGWYDDSNRLNLERAIAETRAASQKAASEAIAKIEVKNTTSIRNVYQGTYTDPNYKDCRHTPENWLNIQKLFEDAK